MNYIITIILVFLFFCVGYNFGKNDVYRKWLSCKDDKIFNEFIETLTKGRSDIQRLRRGE